MAEGEGFVVLGAQYANLETAQEDFHDIKTLHKEKFIGHYEAALFEKEEGGRVKILDTDETIRARNATAGAIVGALFGLLWPPMLLLAGVGAGLGALVAHVAVGLPRRDIRELGEMLDEGEAGIIFVGEPTIERGMERLTSRAAKTMKKEIKADAKVLKEEANKAARAA